MDTLTYVFLPAAFGAAMQEFGYWWQLRYRIEEAQYKAQLKSVAYWVIVLIMILGSGIGTVFWYQDRVGASKDYVVFGAAFPLIFKQFVGALADRAPTMGTETPKTADVVRSYFQIR